MELPFAGEASLSRPKKMVHQSHLTSALLSGRLHARCLGWAKVCDDHRPGHHNFLCDFSSLAVTSFNILASIDILTYI